MDFKRDYRRILKTVLVVWAVFHADIEGGLRSPETRGDAAYELITTLIITTHAGITIAWPHDVDDLDIEALVLPRDAIDNEARNAVIACGHREAGTAGELLWQRDPKSVS